MVDSMQLLVDYQLSCSVVGKLFKRRKVNLCKKKELMFFSHQKKALVDTFSFDITEA